MPDGRWEFYLVPLADGEVLAVGGPSNTNTLGELQPFLYEPPPTDSWSVMAPMDVARNYHSAALLLPDARVLVAGGWSFPFPMNAQIFSPPYLYAPGGGPAARADIVSVSTNFGGQVGVVNDVIRYGNTFTVGTGTNQAGGITDVSLIRLGAATHLFDHDQRFMGLGPPTQADPNVDELSVTAPSTPQEAPPGYYMLFILDDGVPSVSQIINLCGYSSADCNGNGVPDDCDLTAGITQDCNTNGVPDECDTDCDTNGVPDTCEPWFPVAPHPELLDGKVNAKNRYISVTAGMAGRSQAIRVRFVDLPPPFDVWEFDHPERLGPGDYFVGTPVQRCENGGEVLFFCIDGICSNPPPGRPCSTDVDCCGAAGPLLRNWFWAAPLECNSLNAHFMDWAGQCNGGSCTGGLNPGSSCTQDADCVDVVHIFHEGIVPTHVPPGEDPIPAVYDLQVVDSGCPLQDESSFSAPLTMTQARWGDICGCSDTEGRCMTAPDGVPDVINDVCGLIDKFQNINILQKARADLVPGDDGVNNEPDFKVTIIDDALFALDAFQGFAYPFTPGDPCAPG